MTPTAKLGFVALATVALALVGVAMLAFGRTSISPRESLRVIVEAELPAARLDEEACVPLTTALRHLTDEGVVSEATDGVCFVDAPLELDDATRDAISLLSLPGTVSMTRTTAGSHRLDLVVTGPSLVETTAWALHDLRRPIEAREGALLVSVSGVESVLELEVHQASLDQRGVSLLELVARLASENLAYPSGALELGALDVRVGSGSDLGSMSLTDATRLGDVATVTHGERDVGRVAWLGRMRTVHVSASFRTDRDLRAARDELAPLVHDIAPPGIVVRVLDGERLDVRVPGDRHAGALLAARLDEDVLVVGEGSELEVLVPPARLEAVRAEIDAMPGFVTLEARPRRVWVVGADDAARAAAQVALEATLRAGGARVVPMRPEGAVVSSATLDPARAAELGVRVEDLAVLSDVCDGGREVGVFREGAELLPIVVRLDTALAELWVPSRAVRVRLGDVAVIEASAGPVLVRRNGTSATGLLVSGLGDDALRTAILETELPGGVAVVTEE